MITHNRDHNDSISKKSKRPSTLIELNNMMASLSPIN